MKVELVRKIDSDGIWFCCKVNDWPEFYKRDEKEAWDAYIALQELIKSGQYKSVKVLSSVEITPLTVDKVA